MGMDNFDCLNSSFSLFYFYFVTNLQKKKKLWRTYAYSRNSPPPEHEPVRTSERTYFMNDSKFKDIFPWNISQKIMMTAHEHKK